MAVALYFYEAVPEDDGSVVYEGLDTVGNSNIITDHPPMIGDVVHLTVRADDLSQRSVVGTVISRAISYPTVSHAASGGNQEAWMDIIIERIPTFWVGEKRVTLDHL